MDNQQAGTQAAVSTDAATLQDIEKKVFSPEAMDKAQEYLTSVMAICQTAGVQPVFNFDAAETFPAGYNLVVLPLTERVPERGNITRNICIAAVPTIETVMGDESGAPFVTKQITDILIRQVVSSAKAKDGILSLPFKVGDFTTSSRSSGLAAFNALASLYVKALKAKGLKFMNKLLLRQTLTSADLATQQFPRVPQESWVKILDSMMNHAGKEGLEVGNLADWKKTRDSIKVEIAEIDLSDLDGLLGDDEANEPATAETTETTETVS